MILTDEQIHGVNIALNESSLLGVEIDPHRGRAAATFEVMTLPDMGPMPKDRRVQFVFNSVGRVAASLRNGLWNDETAEVVRFDVADLLQVVQSFRGMAIYGWEFLDVDESKNFARWSDRLSLHYQDLAYEQAHTLDLFQADNKRHLDVRLWFSEFIISEPTGEVISLDEFIQSGRRWWDGLYDGDKRTEGLGIFPLKDKPF